MWKAEIVPICHKVTVLTSYYLFTED